MNPLDWLTGTRPRTPGAEMSFFDHLEELRSVLLASLTAVCLFGVGGWYISSRVMDSLVRRAGFEGAQAIQPQEIFVTRFKISAAIGVLVGMPYIAVRVWRFIVPGLMHRERRILFPLVFWSTLLFLLGTAFAVYMLVPIMLGFLASFGTDVVTVKPAVSRVLDFYIFSSLTCGLVFQLPLLVAILSYFGIISPRLLTRYWRHAIAIILVIAAIVTPGPDAVSQLALGIPIIVLYFVSILVSFAARRARRSVAAQPEVLTPDRGEPGPPAGAPSAGPPSDAPESSASEPAQAAVIEPPPAEPKQEEPPSAGRPLHPPDQDWSI
jgi:sec-independent protein translocase protein TatC